MQLTKYLTGFICLGLISISSSVLAEASLQKKVYGRVEPVLLLPDKLSIQAKLDTGAKTASLSAKKIEIIERGNRKFVRFQLDLAGSRIVKELPLYRFSKIKKRHDAMRHSKTASKFSRRPVVKMLICFDHQVKEISVNLVDREHFQYPMLLGRDAIRAFHGVVDPSVHLTTGQSCQYGLSEAEHTK